MNDAIIAVEPPLLRLDTEENIYIGSTLVRVKVARISLDRAWLDRHVGERLALVRHELEAQVVSAVQVAVERERAHVHECIRRMSPETAEALIAALTLSDEQQPAGNASRRLGDSEER